MADSDHRNLNFISRLSFVSFASFVVPLFLNRQRGTYENDEGRDGNLIWFRPMQAGLGVIGSPFPCREYGTLRHDSARGWCCGLRHRADFSRIGGDAVRQVDWPAAFVVVHVHHDLGFARGEFGRFSERNSIRPDARKFESSIAQYELQPNVGRITSA